MKQQPKLNPVVIGGFVLVGLALLSVIAWLKIFNADSDDKAATEQQAQVAPVLPPVLPPNAPKLAGSVIVGVKTPTKYYLAYNGKRYVFPDDTKTFDTWYPNGTKIVKVSQDELESYPLGGNVCYRPGTRLIRITSDLKTYIPAHNCTLRPINDGAIKLLFGNDGKSITDILQDYYFTNYAVGTPVAGPQDYSIVSEQARSATIELDKEIK